MFRDCTGCLLGAGGAILISGLITIGVAYGQDQNLISRCPDRIGCDETMRAEVAATRNLGLAGDVLWLAGAGIVLLGLVLTFTLEEGESEHTEVQVRGVRGGAIASIQGRFR